VQSHLYWNEYSIHTCVSMRRLEKGCLTESQVHYCKLAMRIAKAFGALILALDSDSDYNEFIAQLT